MIHPQADGSSPQDDNSQQERLRRELVDRLLARGASQLSASKRADTILALRQWRIAQGHIAVASPSAR